MSEFRLLRVAVWRELYSRRRAFLISTALVTGLVVGGLLVAAWAIKDDGVATVSVGTLPGEPEALEAEIERRLDIPIQVNLVRVADQATGEEQLTAGAISALVIDERHVLWGPTATSSLVDAVSSAMRALYLVDVAEELGLAPGELTRLLAPIEGRSIEVEQRDPGIEVVSTVSVILMFLAIISYGQWIGYGVVEEKANRVAELVLGALSPGQLLVAKMIGIGALGLAQLVIVGSAAVTTGLLLTDIPLPDVAASTLAWLIVWFLLGFAFYGTLYAAAGSLAADTQQAGNAIGPLNILPGIGYGVGIVSFAAGSEVTARVLSMIPLWTPLLMPGRMARGEAAWWEVGVAVLIMAIAIAAMVRVGARVYLGGITQATRTVGWRQAFRGGSDFDGRSSSVSPS